MAEKELDKRPTTQEFEDIKRKLRVLHTLQYSGANSSGKVVEMDDSSCSDWCENNAEALDMESLLLSKVRALESQLADAKRLLGDAQQKGATLHAELATKQQTIQTLNMLVARLEEDVANFGDGGGGGGGGGAGNASSVATTARTLLTASDVESQILSSIVNTKPPLHGMVDFYNIVASLVFFLSLSLS